MRNLSIVVPCYNEEQVFPETSARLLRLIASLRQSGKVSEASRIYFVDDGSKDSTWTLIEACVRSGGPVVGVKLSRNRGHQNALMAGLLTAEGDAVVSVDADLQDDLDAIERMLDRYFEGADIVYGVRRSRVTDTWMKRVTAETFYRVLSLMGAPTIFNHADYRLLSRRAIEALSGFKEVNLFLRGIVPLLGFKSAVVEYDRAARFAGESKYPFKRMIALSIDAITSFSVLPLRLISLAGFVVSASSMAVTVWVLWVALFSEKTVPGWASTVLPIYFLGGVQLLALGVIGEYLGKMYLEAKARPRFIIERVCGRADAALLSGADGRERSVHVSHLS